MNAHTEMHNQDEWEYEYHARELEEFYFTLDLPTGAAAGDRKRKADDIPSQVAGAKRKTSAAPSGTWNKMQIVGLHEDSPIVSFRGNFYQCHWTEGPGTDVVVSGKDLSNQPRNHSALTDAECKVIAATSTKLQGQPIRLKRKREEPVTDGGKDREQHPEQSSSPVATTQRNTRPTPSREPTSHDSATTYARAQPKAPTTSGTPAAVLPSVISFHARLAEIRARQEAGTSAAAVTPQTQQSPAVSTRNKGRGCGGRPRTSSKATTTPAPRASGTPQHQPPLRPRTSAPPLQHQSPQSQQPSQLPYQWPHTAPAPTSASQSHSSSVPPPSTLSSRSPPKPSQARNRKTPPSGNHWMQRPSGQQTSAEELRRFMGIASDTAREFQRGRGQNAESSVEEGSARQSLAESQAQTRAH